LRINLNAAGDDTKPRERGLTVSDPARFHPPSVETRRE
jgi:hypothetical protein